MVFGGGCIHIVLIFHSALSMREERAIITFECKVRHELKAMSALGQ
jgi:hypothetical protein